MRAIVQVARSQRFLSFAQRARKRARGPINAVRADAADGPVLSRESTDLVTRELQRAEPSASEQLAARRRRRQRFFERLAQERPVGALDDGEFRDSLTTNKQKKALTVAIVGVPNVGKSTILNALTQDRISAVSPKVNTTEVTTQGVYTCPKRLTQLVFRDTPGILALDEDRRGPARQGRPKQLSDRAWKGAMGVEVVLFVVDAARKSFFRDVPVLRGLRRLMSAHPSTQVSLVLNKVDRLDHEAPLRIQELQKRFSEVFGKQFRHTFLTVADAGKGLDELRTYLMSVAQPVEQWEFAAKVSSDLPLEERVCELVREQCYENMHEEIPYTAKFKLDRLQQKDDEWTITVGVTVKRESHIAMFLGKGGQAVEAMKRRVTKTLETMLQAPVSLHIDVRT
ncbi:MAG: hypothetical protein MHM6MM_006561 [Cercozoa sp. M6MM]